MKKRLVVLLVATIIVINACTSNQADVPIAEESPVLEESPLAEGNIGEETEKQNDSEENSTIIEEAAEPEIFTEKSTEKMSFSLNAAGLRPEEMWSLGDPKVYFGQFEGKPVVYRVLPASPETQVIEAEKECLFLDCDSVLLAKEYDNDNQKNEGQEKRQNQWKGSDIEAWGNGDEFYGNSAVFSEIERAAVVSTDLFEKNEAYFAGRWTYQDVASTNHVFLLSAEEAKQLYADNAARAKTGSNDSWWLRSSFAEAGQGAGAVHADGHECNNSVQNFSNGVSPAMNIDLSAILFVSTIGNGEWKVTLLDSGKTVQVTEGQDVTRVDVDTDTVITVPITCLGNDITQISVMITDKEYTAEDAQILFYGALQGVALENPSTEGTFLLPVDLKEQICTTDYHVYIIAEDVNADKRTDYASEPYEIQIP